MLYKYGVRINSNLARDYNNSGIKLTEYSTGLLLPFPWDYFPVISGKIIIKFQEELEIL